MTIGEYLKMTDIDTYRKLMRMAKMKRKKQKKKNEIKLGDSIENLMKHDSYKRVRGALKQIRWG